MTLSFLGINPPSIVEAYGGYFVPFGVVTEVNDEGETEYKGHNVFVTSLTEDQLRKVVDGDGPDRPSILPPGDYTADLEAALNEVVHRQRHPEYPPIEDYLDGVAKDDQAQIDDYKAKCMAVKAKYPLFKLAPGSASVPFPEVKKAATTRSRSRQQK